MKRWIVGIVIVLSMLLVMTASAQDTWGKKSELNITGTAGKILLSPSLLAVTEEDYTWVRYTLEMRNTDTVERTFRIMSHCDDGVLWAIDGGIYEYTLLPLTTQAVDITVRIDEYTPPGKCAIKPWKTRDLR